MQLTLFRDRSVSQHFVPGDTVGRWTLIRVSVDPTYLRYWLCQCDCGNL